MCNFQMFLRKSSAFNFLFKTLIQFLDGLCAAGTYHLSHAIVQALHMFAIGLSLKGNRPILYCTDVILKLLDVGINILKHALRYQCSGIGIYDLVVQLLVQVQKRNDTMQPPVTYLLDTLPISLHV